MLQIFLKTIRDNWVYILIISGIAVLSLWMYIALYPTFADKSGEFEQLFAEFPKEMWKVFGMQNGLADMSSLEKFFSVEMFSLLWPLMGIGIFTRLGVEAVSGEIDKGTTEILLSLPISRTKIFVSKYLAGLFMITVFCIISILSIIPLAVISKIEYNAVVYFKVFIQGLAFMFSGYSLTLLASTVFEKSKVTLFSTLVYLIMYIMNVISSLSKDWDKLKYFSAFYHLDLSQVLQENSLEITSIILFILQAIVFTLISMIIFEKRDIAM